MSLHHEVDWVTPSDRPILVAMPDDFWIKPASLALNVPYSHYTVTERCREMAKHGVLERDPDIAAYRKTELANRIIRDEVTAEELQSN